MKLTHKQREALRLVSEGNSVDQAAALMCVSKSTVEKHLKDARRRLYARNLRNAIYLAAKHGLIVLCCVSVYDVDESRRPVRTRLRRRGDKIELIEEDFS